MQHINVSAGVGVSAGLWREGWSLSAGCRRCLSAGLQELLARWSEAEHGGHMGAG